MATKRTTTESEGFSAEEREAARADALGRLGPLSDASFGPRTEAQARATFAAEHPWFR